MPSLSKPTETCALAECIRIRGQIAAGRNDLTGAERLFERSIGISQRRKHDSSSSEPQRNWHPFSHAKGVPERVSRACAPSSTHSTPSTKSSILPLLGRCWERCVNNASAWVPEMMGCPLKQTILAHLDQIGR